MKLSGSEEKECINAILSVYPTKDDLEKIVRFELEENLQVIAGGDNLRDIVFNLVTKWAIPKGKLAELIQVCCHENPDNSDLKKISQKINSYQENEQHDQLINILQGYFNQEIDKILIAYKAALPNRLIDKKIPDNATEIISGLLLPQQQQEVYSYVQKFVGYLLLDQTICPELKKELKTWGEKNIENCTKLIQELTQVQKQREQQCNPCLMIAISTSVDSYVVEAWLIKNLSEYHRESCSDCEQLKIDNKVQIPTNETLDNLPQLVRHLICESSVNLRQIHIFLPLKLMNYAVDCWTTYENEDETIGEIYEVFIRCSEGLRGKNPRLIAWREKGKLFKDKLGQSAADVFILGDSKEIKTLEKQLKQKSAIAVKIIPVFQNKLPGEILWKAAVPLGLWIRKELPNIDNMIILNELINDGCLAELPERVKLKRLDAMDNPENHVGRHLCLLWDDPDLLPPEPLLTTINL